MMSDPTPEPPDGRPVTADVDEALLDLKYLMSNFLVNTANGGWTWDLQEQLDDLSRAAIDTHQAASAVGTYQGWIATDTTVTPDS
jgi:hypothetical protein